MWILKKIKSVSQLLSPVVKPSTTEATAQLPQIKRSTPRMISKAQRAQAGRLPVFRPPSKILVWRCVNVSRKNKEDPTPIYQIEFNVDVAGCQRDVVLRRSRDEPFTEFVIKANQKINTPVSTSKHRPPEYVNLEFRPADVPETALASKTLADVLEGGFTNFLVNRQQYTLLMDPLDVVSLFLPLRPIVNCPVMPSVDVRNEVERREPTFHWFVRLDDTKPFAINSIRLQTAESERRFAIDNCEYRGTGRIYFPTDDDLNKYLVVLCDYGEDSAVRTALTNKPVSKVNESFLWQERGDLNKDASRTRLVTYNILADLYLDLKKCQEFLFFPYCPKEFQEYEYRYPLILSELNAYNGDIVFLQEVDFRFQMRYLSCFAESNGYKMLFAKKGLEVNEGSAILYKAANFECLHSELSIITDLIKHDINTDIRDMLSVCEASSNLLLNRGAALQYTVLRNKSTNEVYLCANTHLYHNPLHEFVKALQALSCIRRLGMIMDELRRTHDSVKLFFAGDYNSTPDGPVYELFSTGRLASTHECWTAAPSITPFDLELPAIFPDALESLTGTPPYTNITQFELDGVQKGFNGCLDYIWTEKSATTSLDRITLRLPDLDVLQRHQALPAAHSGSDHIALVVDVRL